MRKLFFYVVFWLMASVAFAQQKVHSGKLSKDEEANLTSDQKLVRETDRKTKNGKKRISTKKKVKIQQKQARRAKKIKPSKKGRRD